MPFIKNYSLLNVSGCDFEVAFEMPDNCNYTVGIASKVNFISVALNPGELQPSASYKSHMETISGLDGNFDFYFEQIYNATTTTKPKITVEGC